MQKKKHSCPYCGNNPVPHYLNWYFDSLNILFEKLQIGLLCNPLMRLLSKFEDNIALFMIGFGRLFGIIHLGQKPSKHTLDRAKVLWEEAEKRGYEMREVRVLDRSVDTYIVRKLIPGTRKKKVITFTGIPRPKSTDESKLIMLDDKAYFKKTCKENDLPYSDGGNAFSLSEARAIFDRIQHPVIVKPRLGSRGRHVVTYVRDHDDLRAAFRIARQLCLWVIVEEQLFGPVYRATVINYKLEWVLAGTQPQVVGDGEKSLTELIEAKNHSRPEWTSEVEPNQIMAWFLTRQLTYNTEYKVHRATLIATRYAFGHISSTKYKGNSWKMRNDGNWDASIFDYVPKQWELVYLSEKIGLSYGGGAIEQFDECHKDNKELFERAAKVFGDAIIGFDFMIPDITRSWKTQRCGFLEANSVPFINLHHHPQKGKPRNIAAKIWDIITF